MNRELLEAARKEFVLEQERIESRLADLIIALEVIDDILTHEPKPRDFTPFTRRNSAVYHDFRVKVARILLAKQPLSAEEIKLRTDSAAHVTTIRHKLRCDVWFEPVVGRSGGYRLTETGRNAIEALDYKPPEPSPEPVIPAPVEDSAPPTAE
jgi:hypothetical protein